MTSENFEARVVRALLHLGIVALGLAAIVGSGGGAPGPGLPDTPPCVGTSQGCSPSPPPQPNVVLTPVWPIVQVGTPLDFSVTTDARSPVYHWCWQPKGATACTEIPGAGSPNYAVAAATLEDDGAIVKVTVKGSNGQASAATLVAVSSMPAVTLTDGEFPDAEWNQSAVANPALPGLVSSASRVDSGGHPGAYRKVIVDLPLEVRTVNLLASSTALLYDPAAQGAIYQIEFSLDCDNISVAQAPTYIQYWLPALEQNGRRFLPDHNAGATCYSPGWNTRSWVGLGAAAFRLVDGPPCGSGEACPDFSSQGLPLRLGMSYNVELRAPLPEPGAASAPHFEQGFDNFRAAVWRH